MVGADEDLLPSADVVEDELLAVMLTPSGDLLEDDVLREELSAEAALDRWARTMTDAELAGEQRVGRAARSTRPLAASTERGGPAVADELHADTVRQWRAAFGDWRCERWFERNPDYLGQVVLAELDALPGTATFGDAGVEFAGGLQGMLSRLDDEQGEARKGWAGNTGSVAESKRWLLERDPRYGAEEVEDEMRAPAGSRHRTRRSASSQGAAGRPSADRMAVRALVRELFEAMYREGVAHALMANALDTTLDKLSYLMRSPG